MPVRSGKRGRLREISQCHVVFGNRARCASRVSLTYWARHCAVGERTGLASCRPQPSKRKSAPRGARTHIHVCNVPFFGTKGWDWGRHFIVAQCCEAGASTLCREHSLIPSSHSHRTRPCPCEGEWSVRAHLHAHRLAASACFWGGFRACAHPTLSLRVFLTLDALTTHAHVVPVQHPALLLCNAKQMCVLRTHGLDAKQPAAARRADRQLGGRMSERTGYQSR